MANKRPVGYTKVEDLLNRLIETEINKQNQLKKEYLQNNENTIYSKQDAIDIAKKFIQDNVTPCELIASWGNFGQKKKSSIEYNNYQNKLTVNIKILEYHPIFEKAKEYLLCDEVLIENQIDKNRKEAKNLKDQLLLKFINGKDVDFESLKVPKLNIKKIIKEMNEKIQESHAYKTLKK